MFLFVFLALFLIPSSLLAQQCFNEDCTGVGAFESSKIGKLLDSKNAGLASALKSTQELDKYFACHISTGLTNSEKRVREARLKEFQALYKPMIELGSQHFQMPYALTACVMFRESQFDRNITSSANARGIAQFTAPTYETLKNDIANVIRVEEDYQKFLKLDYEDMTQYQGPDNWFIRCTQVLQGEGILNQQLTPTALDESRDICKKSLSNHARYKPILDNMVTYLKDVSRHYNNTSNPRFKSMFPNTTRGQWPKGGDLRPPQNFEDMLREPAWVVAMNMFYLKQRLIEANSMLDMKSFDPSQDMVGFLTTIGGSYNRGPGALIDAVKGKRQSVRDWCRIVSRGTENDETKHFMLSLRRCMTRNSYDPPANQDSNSTCQTEMTPATQDPCDPIKPGLGPTVNSKPLAPSKSVRPPRSRSQQ